MKTLVYFGNNNLQKDTITVSNSGNRYGAGQRVQDIDISRLSGSKVVNTKLDSKVIDIEGVLKNNANVSMQSVVDDLGEILNESEEHYLRFVQNYYDLTDTTSTANWTSLLNAENISVDSTKFQLDNDSISFDQTTSTANVSIQLNNTSTADYSTYLASGYNLEGWVYLPNSYYVTSVEIGIGNDSSNYYSVSFTSNYEGNLLKNGWNYFSAPFSSLAQTGSVTKTTIDYIFVTITIQNDPATALDGFKVGGILFVEEATVRNYRAYRSGQFQVENNYFNIEHARFNAQFLNHTGCAESTHYFEELASTTSTGNSYSGDYEIAGTVISQPEFTITLNTATGVTGINYTNVDNSQTISLSSTFTSGDVIEFGGNDYIFDKNGSPVDYSGVIPFSILGVNNYQIGFQTSSAVLEPTSEMTDLYDHLGYSTTAEYYAQSFVSSVNGAVSNIKLKYYTNRSSMAGTVSLYSNSAGSPSAVLFSSVLPISASMQEVDITPTGDWTLTSGTTYWLVVNTYTYSWSSGTWQITIRTCDSSEHSGEGKIKASLGGAWTDTPEEIFFQITETPTTAINYDIEIKYKKLYLN